MRDQTVSGWLGPRGGHDNRARSTAPGRLAQVPIELWQDGTGSDVRHARVVPMASEEGLFVHAGTVVHLLGLDGRSIWSSAQLGVRALLHVGPIGARGRWAALLATGDSSVALLELTDGRVGWEWECEGRANLTGQASSKIVEVDGETRWVVFPSYSTVGRCFDLSAEPGPSLLWEHDLGDSIDAGFGPSVVISDVLGSGRPQVVISSRSGTVYPVSARDRRTTSAELVQGRADGHLTQRVLDIDSGAEVESVRYRPDDGPYPCARPYGLLTTVERPSDRRRDIMLVSCQVEEYLSLTHVDNVGMSRAWGAFIERDWPLDLRELRPQVTSIASFSDERRPELVVGLWDAGAWNTVIVDLDLGWESPRDIVHGMYFWGCHDVNGDGRLEIIVSPEVTRAPRPSSLLALDGRTLEVVAALDGAEPLTTADGDLPVGTTFMAARRSLVEVTLADGLTGVLVQRSSGGPSEVGVWHGANGQATYRGIGASNVARVDYHDHRLVVADSSGILTVYDSSFETIARIPAPAGGLPELRAWLARSDSRHGGLMIGRPDGSIMIGEPDLAAGHGWRSRSVVVGSLPAIDPADGVLIHAQTSSNGSTLSYTDPAASPASTRTTQIEGVIGGALVPYGRRRVLANVTTGVHTTVLSARGEDGAEAWSVAGGAHPHPAAAWCGPDGEWSLIADDHGVLRIFDDRGTPRAEADWYASYTTPVPFGVGSLSGILRGDGTHGIERVDATGLTVWRREAELWSLFGNHGALGQLRDGRSVWAQIHRDGTFELIDVEDGRLLGSSMLGKTCHAQVLAIDVDADADDEYVVGTMDGTLWCLKLDSDAVVILWRLPLGASVGPIGAADIDGDGFAELLVATADGIVRVLGAAPVGRDAYQDAASQRSPSSSGGSGNVRRVSRRQD